eukprot:TRINITY_DN10905_c0_g4_i3.p1 TRINITY_DN10905_c0_g4~~TRINITY_DN10905_c0_g4_i3.p1  ORF type:complete len:626 (-),score=109.43 TRINITY_DN10905_c0_g4_i3:334-2211(-)
MTTASAFAFEDGELQAEYVPGVREGPCIGVRPMAISQPGACSREFQAIEDERQRIREFLQERHDALLAEFDIMVLADGSCPPAPADEFDVQITMEEKRLRSNGAAACRTDGIEGIELIIAAAASPSSEVKSTFQVCEDDVVQADVVVRIPPPCGDCPMMTTAVDCQARTMSTITQFIHDPGVEKEKPNLEFIAGDRLSHTSHRSTFRTDASCREPDKNIFRRLVTSSAFEVLFAGLIALNTVTMCLEAQYSGFDVGFQIRHRSTPQDAAKTWPFAVYFFNVLEYFFGVAFTIEVVAKLLATGTGFLYSPWNIFDTFIIVFWLFDRLQGAMSSLMNPMFLRLARLCRLLRLLRFVKAFQVFDVLHLLLGAVKACSSVLLWSVVVLALIMTTCTLLLNYITQPVILNSATDPETADKLFEYFGTYSRGFCSMYEITMVNYAPITRVLQEGVSEWLGPAIMFYRLFVNFALLKVINGIFMHETFRVAGSDDEIMILQKKRNTDMHIKKMTKLFQEADESGDGLLERHEFKAILADPRVKTWLAAQELDIRDPDEAFSLVDTGRGVISAEDLVRGFSRLKGNAKSLDMLSLFKRVDEIKWRMDVIESATGTKSPYYARSMTSSNTSDVA